MLMETQNLAQTYPLAMANEGETVKLIRVTAAINLIKPLMIFGFVEGAVLKIVQRQIGTGLVVACGETRLAFGIGMAQKIMVAPVSEENTSDLIN